MTTRGLTEADFTRVADILHRALQIALVVQGGLEAGAKSKVDEFVAALKGREDIAALRKEVNEWASSFAMPGFGSEPTVTDGPFKV